MANLEAVDAILRIEPESMRAALRENRRGAIRMDDGRVPTDEEFNLIFGDEADWESACMLKQGELEFNTFVLTQLRRGAELLRKRESCELSEEESVELEDLKELVNANLALRED